MGTTILIDLRNELLNDKQQLREVIEFQSSKELASREIMKLLEEAQESDKALIDSLFHYIINGNRTFFPTSGVYDSGLSTGKIENIGNDQLKYQIMNLYNHFYERLYYNGEIYDQCKEQIAWNRKEYFDKSSKKVRSWEQILDLKFFTHVEYMLTQTELYVDLSQDNLDEIDKTIKLINKEIK